MFLAGGGSKLVGLRELVAQCLDMDDRRVALAGNNYEISAFSQEYELSAVDVHHPLGNLLGKALGRAQQGVPDLGSGHGLLQPQHIPVGDGGLLQLHLHHELNDPEYATPLGIAVSAGLGLISDSYRILLNGQPAKLFRSGKVLPQQVLSGPLGGLSGHGGDKLDGVPGVDHRRGGRILAIELQGAGQGALPPEGQPPPLRRNPLPGLWSLSPCRRPPCRSPILRQRPPHRRSPPNRRRSPCGSTSTVRPWCCRGRRTAGPTT